MEPRSPAAHRTKDFAALQTKTPAIAAGVELSRRLNLPLLVIPAEAGIQRLCEV